MNSKTYKIFFIVPICYIRLSENVGRGVKLSDTLLLSNDSSCIKHYLDWNFRDYAGRGDFDALTKRGSVFAYSVRTVALESMGHEDLMAQLNVELMYVLQFLSFLWIVRDNAAYPDCGYLIVYEGTKPIRIAKNYWGDHFSIASGGNGELPIFSADEIRSIRDLAIGRSSYEEAVASQSLHKFVSHNPEHNRILRSLSAVHGARVAVQLPQKIASYITALETLFSTSASELTYRLSERVAFFLGSTPTHRREIFESVKTAYSVRSSVVHGDILQSKYRPWEALSTISEQCDNLLREALMKIMTSEKLSEIFCSKKNEVIDVYFSDLIFSDIEKLGGSIEAVSPGNGKH